LPCLPGSDEDDPVPTNASQAEYLHRVQRVVDYIEAHLGEELTLEQLARVACFSPYHFHRLFSALVGESLYRFILRLRLEKAAGLLCRRSGESVTAIALDCGFGSSAAFARAFRAAFGVSASEWRDRKDREAMRKPGEEGASADAYPGLLDHGRKLMKAAQQMKEASSVRIETLPPATVAYVRHVGPYAGDGQLFAGLYGRLMQWAGPRGLLGPDARTYTIYHDDPAITEEEKLRISVCLTVPPGTPTEGDIGSMELPGGKYALAHFELDLTEYGAAWAWVFASWLPESGFQPDDRPCFEQCAMDAQRPDGKYAVDIGVAVRPL
jgi:AraC family transcriptional regulator